MKHIVTAAATALVCIAFLSCSKDNSEDSMKSGDRQIIHDALGAGRWFPASGETLARMISGFLDKADATNIEGRIVSIIAPHAGYDYSGKVAGYAFRAVMDAARKGKAPETVVILGFPHRSGLRGVALMDGDAIKTPLGTALLDKEAAAALIAGHDKIYARYDPHAGEHSAENQIPFVQAILPKARLVVAMIGDHDAGTLSQLVDALNQLAASKSILVVASSDMLHDPDYDLVSATDRETLKHVARMDYTAVANAWSMDKQIFCGIMPVLAVMRFAEGQGCKKGIVLHYRNNGDDDPSSRGNWVVGYGAVAFAAPK